ncbi:alkyl hydroperoxide reductase AhpD [Marinobacterium nitratireducens]|uniref:Alkyl hydroperoxide reductase AhpD n=1 Tax=Marinobacterium nitratireducens TaxID=518897 RepID=A0A918DRW2_9GAMM|nr:carboxymuconolactone decarboxylase family protein [Marinobacterium nitratireducens]GGO81582.1 alkyl hydroperoxide reductase AhpD [Marinobacterium nitratireducens]
MSDTIPHTTVYPDRLRNFEKTSRDLSSAQPAVMKAFWGLHTTAVADGALDTKTKELIALAISVVTRCDDCIAHHTYDALEAGATQEEFADALGVAILMGGGTSVVYATHAIEALEQFSALASE